MIARCIGVKGNPTSEAGVRRVQESATEVGCDFDIEMHEAPTPEEVQNCFEKRKHLRWTHPWVGQTRCPYSGLTLHAYRTRNRQARMSCFLAHFALWSFCARHREMVLVLEDDTVFVQKFTRRHVEELFAEGDFGAVSINDPRGATRKSADYHAALQKDRSKRVIQVPLVDDNLRIPQGLPGHSAYIIHPDFARLICDYATTLGAWPNDALMCRQIFPSIGCSTSYYTTVTGRPSSLA